MMTAFMDRTLIDLAVPANLAALLNVPARLSGLLAAVYDFPFGRVHDIKNLRVVAVERARPLFMPERTLGKWLRTLPSHEHTDIQYETVKLDNPVWIDLNASVMMDLILELDPGEIESVVTKGIDDIVSLEDFRSRFRFLDLDDFLARHRISTVEELREASHYLLTEIHVKAPAAFDPDDPANSHAYCLDVGLLIRDTLDIAEILREVKITRLVAERSLAFQHQAAAFDVLTPIALLLVFPAVALTDDLTEETVRAFFAAEKIQVVFRL